MLPSVLIANRGEIACRIIRTARAMGMRTVAVFSEADRHALHVKMADAAYLVGPAPANESYLCADVILSVARLSGAACIHPGYGFLSENAAFAEACAGAGIVFVGPPPAAIRAMGLKDGAKTLMQKAGVPVVRGYHGPHQEVKFLKEKAYEIGYPVLIKAVAGGGGKGMRRVDVHADFEEALAGAQREALGAFGNAHVLIEKYVASPRHIEVQVFGDRYGNVVHLFERDCTLQRRHQKVIEEAPAPNMTVQLRAAMGQAAVEAARAVGYQGAGTVEFIVDGARGLRADGFFFMEMNTRLQVEHPVTEAILGLDLVEWQFRVAGGEKLPLTQADLHINGHAFEARLYAEDPESGFLPSTGRLVALHLPVGEGIRVDAGVECGGDVTPFYDPMIAKIIAHGATRSQALARLAEALQQVIVAGPKTNVAFLQALCAAPAFVQGAVDTGFIGAHLAALGAQAQPVDAHAVAAGLAAALTGQTPRQKPGWQPFDARDGFQLGAIRRTPITVLIDGVRIETNVCGGWPDSTRSSPLAIEIPSLNFQGDAHYQLAGPACPQFDVAFVATTDGEFLVVRKGRQTRLRLLDPLETDASVAGDGDGTVCSPMHGKVIALLADIGSKVVRGTKLAIVEAMKMEHALLSPCTGIVAQIAVTVGQQVTQGARIIVIEAGTAEDST